MIEIDDLFTVRRCGPERGDCTAPYVVIFSNINPHPTVKEFLDSVISNKREWGEILITPDPNCTNVWSLIGKKRDILDYKWGEWGKQYDIFLEKYSDQTIVSATADGGWSRMDYILLLENTVKYKEFGNIDIPAEFEITLNDARDVVDRMLEQHLISNDEYNKLYEIIDGAEKRRKDLLRVLNNG